MGACQALIDLLDELVTEHELWVLPCRDPIGLSGYRHALHLGLVRKKGLFPTCVENIKMIIYQDRLGTNIGKTHKKITVVYSCSRLSLSLRLTRSRMWLRSCESVATYLSTRVRSHHRRFPWSSLAFHWNISKPASAAF